MLRLASECGLLGPLGDSAADEWAHGAAATGQAALLVTLRARVRRRVRELWDCGRLGTALTHFKKYLSATGRVPFMPVERAGDITSLVYNQETLELFAEWLRSTGGQKADTIAGYVSVIKGLRDAEAHYHVTSDVVNTAMPRAFKRYRQIDGPPGERKLTHGFRAYMFRELVSGGYDRTSARGIVRWAAALGAHNLLLRGGELGTVAGKAFCPQTDAALGAIDWKAPCPESKGRAWLTWDTVPIKDVAARRRICPMLVCRRGGPDVPLGADPLCTYDAIALLFQERIGRVPATGRVTGEEGLMPLFVGRNGRWWTTDDSRELAREMGTALGLDPAALGARSFRVGGATDYKAKLGAGAERFIQERGRWCSDIGRIYTRALAAPHLAGSADVGDADGVDVETLCPGWVQPAAF